MKMKNASNSKQKAGNWTCPSYRAYGVKGVDVPKYRNGGAAKTVGKCTGYGVKGV